MSVENEVKSLIMTAVWNALANSDKVKAGFVNFYAADEVMEAVADDVYSAIWEYIVDTD